MKNQLNSFYILLFGCICFYACNSKLDIQPAQGVSPEEALSTSKQVEGVLIGAYAALGDQNVLGGALLVEADLLGDNGDVIWTGTFQGMTQIYNKAIPINNGFITNNWLNSYAAINTVNNVLSALDTVVEIDRARVEGEAKFIRGTLYFELVKLYAKTYQDGDPNTNHGVPLVLTPTRSVTPGTARNSVAEVYTQVISDLTDAANLLPESNGFFANKYAAQAMLTRVFLMQGNYESARNYADSVIVSGVFSLIKYYPDEFPYPGQVRILNTNEDIFAIQVSDQHGFNTLNEFYASSDDGGRGDIEMTDQHLNRYDPNDQRLNLFYDDSGSIRTGKFSNVYGNVKILRLSEMFLTRAECNLRLGTTVGATPAADLNTVRARVGLADNTNPTLDDILSERYLELAFEGQSLHDIKRTQGSVGALPWNDPSLVFPIPQREIIVNPNLVQNEGY